MKTDRRSDLRKKRETRPKPCIIWTPGDQEEMRCEDRTAQVTKAKKQRV